MTPWHDRRRIKALHLPEKGTGTMPHITVELHCHTYRSTDSLILPARLLAVCEQQGIDKLAVTDHNTLDGALEAAQLEPKRVIIGEEIQTTKGELLAYFVKEHVPPGLTPEETIDILRRQGAFISVSHPCDALRSGSWRMDDLRAILPRVDALEVFNARTLLSVFDRKAAILASEAGLLTTAGSDAHAYSEVGRTVLRLPSFDDPQSMRAALASAHIVGRRSSPLVHFSSRYAAWRKAIGWQAP
jgi:predicted metal-dependent phosphoesterase TrpH